MTDKIETQGNLDLKQYKVLIPYTESASIHKIYKIEYEVKALDNFSAIRKAEKLFNLYCDSNSASWVRTMNKGGIRVWRILKDLPQHPDEIDELSSKLANTQDKKEIIEILNKLSLLEDTSTTSYVLAQSKNPNREIAYAAIETLENIGDPTCLLAIKNLYNKESTPIDLKIRIIYAISKIALPEDNIFDFMDQIKDTKDEKIQSAVADAYDILESRALSSGWMEWLRKKRNVLDDNLSPLPEVNN